MQIEPQLLQCEQCPLSLWSNVLLFLSQVSASFSDLLPHEGWFVQWHHLADLESHWIAQLYLSLYTAAFIPKR